MNLEAYVIGAEPQPLVPAPVERDWMSGSPLQRHAHRCLPLTIANTYGWQLILPEDVTASWTGGLGHTDVTVVCKRPYQAVSNFANGILTFDVGYLFRTPPDFHMLVTGPSNTFKDGAAPMTAVVETDWVPYTFTMNYRFTRPGTVCWKAGEPYAQICIIPAGVQQKMQPVVRCLASNPELEADHIAWRERRTNTRARLATGDMAKPWDRDYFLGRYADGRDTDAEHTNRLRLREPVDAR